MRFLAVLADFIELDFRTVCGEREFETRAESPTSIGARLGHVACRVADLLCRGPEMNNFDAPRSPWVPVRPSNELMGRDA